MKRFLLLTLAVMLLASCFTVAHAQEITRIEPAGAVCVNPCWDGVPEINTIQPRNNTIYTSDSFHRSIQDAGKFMRGGLVQRAEIIEVKYAADYFLETEAEAQAAAIAAEIVNEALQHTGSATEGDYLMWQYIGYEVYAEHYFDYKTGKDNLTFTFYNAYFTNAEEEAQVDSAVAALLTGFRGGDEYHRVKAAYDWVTANVTCTPISENSNLQDFTAYGAIINRSANSMGIANLMYRLLLELGIDNRIISGTYNGTAQLWNIVQMVEDYYNIDAALDCNKTTKQYFMRCDANFNHVRDPLFEDELFCFIYPIDDEDYVHGMNKVLDSGYCGKDGDEVYWKFTSDGVLTIYGEGQMGDYYVLNQSYNTWHRRHNEITAIVIEKGITRIGDQAFLDCQKITNITIPEGVTYIGAEAFKGCYALANVTLPESLAELGASAFHQCNELRSIRIPDGITVIREKTFANCNLTDIRLPSNLTEIERLAFEWCAFETLALPETVTTIGELAFARTGLKEITIPNSVTKLGKGVLFCCPSLTKVTLPENLVELPVDAFSMCTELTEINLPDSITVIGEEAFNACYALTKLILPPNVAYIGRSAFQRNSEMELYFTGDPPEFHETALWNLYGTAYYPAGNEKWTEDVRQGYGGYAFSWAAYDVPSDDAIDGDLNADGTVDDSDVALLLWHTLFPENYPISGNADFNGDSVTDDADVAYLLWHTLFPENYPL